MSILNTKQIMEIIPHRQPFLLIDTIEELEVGKKAVGKKCVSYNEPFFAGYFPSHGVDPFMVATYSDEGQGAFGYWIYPLGDGSSGYLQPVWMAVM